MVVETDLHEHIHLENNILFPRALVQTGSVQNATFGRLIAFCKKNQTALFYEKSRLVTLA